jgi:tetratricopeptide (TPR) repeat protein
MSAFHNQYINPKREKYKGKPGFSWRYPSTIFAQGNVNKEQLDVFASMGGYNPSIGIQSGNYTFGCWYVNTNIIVPSYQSAIDKHPEWWHLHESLGDWFERIDDHEKALKSYATAMKHNSQRCSSSQYWEVLANVRKNNGDIHGAVDAYRKGEVSDKDRTSWYWDQMAKIYKEQKDWENMKNIYCEAIGKHADNSKGYWLRLAEIYEDCLDWKNQLDVYFSAIVANPNNMQEYSESICCLAKSFARQMLFAPAITILTAVMERHVAELARYQKTLANIYMAARQWDKAQDLYMAILEGPCAEDFMRSSDDDLTHAHLALGDTTRALALYNEKYFECQAKGDYSGLSSYGASAHMLAGDFHSAIRLLKADITNSYSVCPGGPSDIHITHSRVFPEEVLQPWLMLRGTQPLGGCSHGLLQCIKYLAAVQGQEHVY